MIHTRAALLRFARVLERRGDGAADAYLRASAAPRPFIGGEAERALRELIEALVRHDEHDVLDALRPEVEQSYRVGHVYAKALGRRGSLVALDSFVRAPAHHWERATRLDGALSVVVHRGEAGRALTRSWLALGALEGQEAARAHLHCQSLLGQALAWLGDHQGVIEPLRLLEREAAKAERLDAMTGKLELAPLCTALGEVERANALLRAAYDDWDAIFDEDVDGYGRVSRNALDDAAERVRHLDRQHRLALPQRTWATPETPTLGYLPPLSANARARRNEQTLRERLLAGDVEGALDALELEHEGGEWASLLGVAADALEAPTREQGARLAAIHARLPRGPRSVNWHAFCAREVCGALARAHLVDQAFALAASVSAGRLTDRPEAQLACAELVVSRREKHPALLAAVESAIAELTPHASADDQTDVFKTPLSFALLIHPLC